MNIIDEGYIIGLRKHGDKSLILTVLTKHNGKLIGYVKGALSKKTFSTFQLGNLVHIQAYARLDENMLSFRIELIAPVAVSFMSSPQKLDVLSSFCTLCHDCLPEKEPLERFFYYIDSFFSFINEENWFVHYALFEYFLLDFLGIGLDLSECSATGVTENLAYVSPKSGKAVCFSAGQPYKDRLYQFPHFVVENNYFPTAFEVADLLDMTAFFLNKNFFKAHGLKFPIKRANLREITIEYKEAV
ncbi:MAG: DNA repair protein RecO [Alphaproteobacteria bacterium]|nr:DNA repair protein RecO [Alphaproteobacteria bacterium]